MRCLPVVTGRVAVPRRSACVRVRASLETASEVVGKSLLAFVGTYAALQWLYYRGMRQDIEKAVAERDKKEGRRGADKDKRDA